MKMLRQILGISWQEHKINKSILQETAYTKELLTSIKKRKLTYAGHIARSPQNRLEKTVCRAVYLVREAEEDHEKAGWITSRHGRD